MPSRVKPLLIYDGDCNFCRRWITNWQCLTGDRVEYAPFQQAASQFPQIPVEQFASSVQLIEPSGEVFAGAEAVFRTLAYAPRQRWMLWIYEKIPGAAVISEWFYHFVAQHRNGFSVLMRRLWGDPLERPTYFLSPWLFLRLLGTIYFIAFVSLWTQLSGLVGSNGILPARYFLAVAHERIGPSAYRLLPTLCWFNSSDGFLQFLCGGGAILSMLLILGIASTPILLLLWVFYLSLMTVCRDFLGFQWDALLLEASFLAIFLAPWQIMPRFSSQSAPSTTVLWLLRWLLFRLIFSSGVVKLTSGDPTWRNFTALNYHYETQPLPNWVSWYLHQLPEWFQKISVFSIFAVELFVPLLIFAPRRLRHKACAALIAFQLLIIATGNYAFFNLLTISLCILLLDDAAWVWRWYFKGNLPISPATHQARPWSAWIVTPVATIILLLTTVLMLDLLRVRINWPRPIMKLYSWLAPFNSVNSYGLFAVMTTSRPEIIVEGSSDGVSWRPYEFKYKPGSLMQRPRFVAPHQPRLDWQMWFAALGNYHDHPWFGNFCKRLLQGSPEVLSLLAKNPFPGTPPRYVRAVVYDYHFTDFATRRANGAWWRSEMKSLYSPVFFLPKKSSG